jgi:hypothetical protein
MIRTLLKVACIPLLVMSAAAQNAVPTIQEQVSQISHGSYALAPWSDTNS